MSPVSVGMDLVTVTLHSDYLSQIVRCLPAGEASLNPLPAPPFPGGDKCVHSPVGRESDGATTKGDMREEVLFLMIR